MASLLDTSNVHAAGAQVVEGVAVFVEEVGNDVAVVVPVQDEFSARDRVVVAEEGDRRNLAVLPPLRVGS